MITEISLAGSLGFRHAIEDALSILANEPVDADRRQYVLQELTSLLKEAHKGSELIRQDRLFAGSDYRRAFESFSLFSRYLRPKYQERLPERLQETVSIFQHLQGDEAVKADSRDAATEVLSELLASIKREAGTGIPHYPEEISLMG